MKPSTVREIIEALKKLPPELPVYARSKYAGDVKYTDSNPVSANGISRMEDLEIGENVTILF